VFYTTNNLLSLFFLHYYFYESGQLQGEGVFKEGKREGPYKKYYESGDRKGERENKGARNMGAVLTITDHLGIGPFAKQELQGLQNNGFACSGLAGHRQKTRRECHVEVVNQCEIADVQCFEHNASPIIDLRSVGLVDFFR